MVARSCSPPLAREMTGMRPSVGQPVTRSRSSLVRMRSSRVSNRKARPTPSMRPTTRASTALRSGWGENGSVGSVALEMIWAPPVWVMRWDTWSDEIWFW